jgi:hypothetical protein
VFFDDSFLLINLTLRARDIGGHPVRERREQCRKKQKGLSRPLFF